MNPQRGEIYFLPFGDGKERPVVIVSRDILNTGDYVVVVPFTARKLDTRKGLQSCAFFERGEGGLKEDCVAKADEVTRIRKTEIDWTKSPMGRLRGEQMKRIVRAVRYVIRDESLDEKTGHH
jgi:mRNA-degrading endonuclease toxin of MazEF toxin-antitoxin module